MTLTLNGDRVLLVAVGAGRVHGIEKLSGLIMRAANDAGCRRAVHVDIEDIEKNAYAFKGSAFDFNCRNVGDFAVGGRNHRAGIIRDCALGIAKEPQEERGQENRNRCPGWLCKPADKEG